ncbi:MAG: response regulator [Cyclobacteriaceae bacterium]
MINALLLDDIDTSNKLMLRQINNGLLAIQVIAQCTTVDQVYDYLQQHTPPDIIFTDYQLASITGTEFIESLQQQQRFQQTKFVLISGYSYHQLPDLGSVVLHGYIEKPVSRFSYSKFVSQFGNQWPSRNKGPTN